jgi:undecaprenyl-diphosphatase
MIEWIAVILLGVIEGVTEFLPISSTGHLLLVEYLFKARTGLEQQSDLFNTVIQCGAVLAVLVIFARRAKQLFFQWREPAARDYLLKLAGAFVVTAIGGVALKKAGLQLPEAAGPVVWATLIGGIGILAIERWMNGKTVVNEITWTCAIVVGLAQLLAAVFPGTSRSAATILAAVAIGVSRPAATEFSFLVGIPTLLSAGALQIFSAWHHAHKSGMPMAENWGRLVVATVIAAITAFLVVKWLLRFVQNHTFVVFGWYRIGLVLGLLILWFLERSIYPTA